MGRSEDEESHPRLRAAVALVLADVEAVLGPEAVSVTFPAEATGVTAASPWSERVPLAAAWVDVPGELEATSVMPALARWVRGPRAAAWAHVPGELGGTGLDDGRMTDVDLLVSAAEHIQETIIESARNWGVAFPPCPDHPNHPLWPEERNGRPVWACPHGPAVVPIGELAGSAEV